MSSNWSNIGGSVRTLKVEHAWTIDNISARQTKPGEGIVSPTFIVGGNGDLQGRLVLFPRGHRIDNSDYLSLFLYLDSCERNVVKAKLKCRLLLENRNEVASCGVVHSFIRGQGYGFPGFARRDLLILAGHGLSRVTIVCCVSVLSQSEDEVTTKTTTATATAEIASEAMAAGERFIRTYLESIESTSEKPAVVVQSSSDDAKDQRLGQLTENEFSDVTLVARGIEFRAHRNILAARSLIFSAMFMRKTNESTKSKIELDDVQPEVLREMLRFIYTGKVENWKLVPGLLDAADKYGLGGLKTLCERVLFNSMNLNNVFEILLLADRHNVHRLKKQALEIIIQYAKVVITTPGFQTLKESKRTDLMAEAFCALALMKPI